jgi:hypothetical protein
LKSRPRSADERHGGTDDRRGGTTGGRRDIPDPLLRIDRLLPEPDRLYGQRRYDTDVLGRLAFIGVAQSAGFKLSEIKDMVGGIEDGDGLSNRIRSLSVRTVDEVEALLLSSAPGP